MTKLLRKFVLLVIFLWLVVRGYAFFSSAYIGAPAPGPSRTVSVTAPLSPAQAADLLLQQQVIHSTWGFRFYLWLERTPWQAKIGTYDLQPGTSYKSLARTLALGPARRESQVRLLEGWTVDDEADYLSREKGIKSTESARIMGRSADRVPFDTVLRENFPFLKDLPSGRSLEGYLAPDTYRIWDDQLPEGLVRKQLQAFDDNFGNFDVVSLPAPLKTLDDVVILASIVEKEVRGETDQKIVAGIFLSRLKIGMGLQSDAALTYGLENGHVRATSADLATETPYNLYKHRGLPPSPICNPGTAAIRAVLNPTSTDYLYFLTDSEGRVLYGRTLEDHVRNRRKAGY